jgi:hypothetical protein
MKRDPENKKGLSRRDLVKTTAAGFGAAAVTGLAASVLIIALSRELRG